MQMRPWWKWRCAGIRVQSSLMLLFFHCDKLMKWISDSWKYEQSPAADEESSSSRERKVQWKQFERFMTLKGQVSGDKSLWLSRSVWGEVFQRRLQDEPLPLWAPKQCRQTICAGFSWNTELMSLPGVSGASDDQISHRRRLLQPKRFQDSFYVWSLFDEAPSVEEM